MIEMCLEWPQPLILSAMMFFKDNTICLLRTECREVTKPYYYEFFISVKYWFYKSGHNEIGQTHKHTYE